MSSTLSSLGDAIGCPNEPFPGGDEDSGTPPGSSPCIKWEGSGGGGSLPS